MKSLSKSVSIGVSILAPLAGTLMLMGAAANDPSFDAVRVGSFCPDGAVCRHGGVAASNPFDVRFGQRRASASLAGFGDANLAHGGSR